MVYANEIEENSVILDNILWSDEVSFKLSGHINRPNCNLKNKYNLKKNLIIYCPPNFGPPYIFADKTKYKFSSKFYSFNICMSYKTTPKLSMTYEFSLDMQPPPGTNVPLSSFATDCVVCSNNLYYKCNQGKIRKMWS